MAPPRQAQSPFAKDERVLCFHMEMLYEAKILDMQPGDEGEGWQYRIHYKGWKSSWDDWVPVDRVRKFTDDNKQLASQLMAQFKLLQSGKPAKQPKKGPRATTSDIGSTRGSEERMAGAATQASRGPRRVRDYDLEHVGFLFSFFFPCFFLLCEIKHVSPAHRPSLPYVIPPEFHLLSPSTRLRKTCVACRARSKGRVTSRRLGEFDLSKICTFSHPLSHCFSPSPLFYFGFFSIVVIFFLPRNPREKPKTLLMVILQSQTIGGGTIASTKTISRL